MAKAPRTDSVSFTGKGQVVIPVWMRRLFDIEEGTTASISVTKEGILLKPITPAYIRSLRGKYKHLPLMETLAEDRKREREN
ncbi:MAG TPA: AbrB/MazE/SpoVT family DNA-binding domain-containing protein [Verrucomicrobiales bacterium]|nr:AbrB/MazE/SpoVT family DNA-binding domain-containing protein [Verrucomicrobiales bacterium]